MQILDRLARLERPRRALEQAVDRALAGGEADVSQRLRELLLALEGVGLSVEEYE